MVFSQIMKDIFKNITTKIETNRSKDQKGQDIEH